MTTLPFLPPWEVSTRSNLVHPVYMPFPFLPFRREMNLKERVINAVGTFGLNLVRKYYIPPKIEKMLGEVFPGEKIPDLNQASQAVFSINLGSSPMKQNTSLDGPLSSVLDKAVWWLEDILRHPGKPLMENSETWLQYYLLDVMFVLVTLMFLFLFLFKKFVDLTILLFNTLAGMCRKKSSEKNGCSSKKNE